MRDTYTNSIINDNDVVNLKYKMNRIRLHMQLKQYTIYFMGWTSEISNDDENVSLIKSCMGGNKCGNVL